MKGTHPSLMPSEDIDVTECITCGSTTEDGCDCILESEEESDYETASDNECDPEGYTRDLPDIQVRRYQFPTQ